MSTFGSALGTTIFVWNLINKNISTDWKVLNDDKSDTQIDVSAVQSSSAYLYVLCFIRSQDTKVSIMIRVWARQTKELSFDL